MYFKNGLLNANKKIFLDKIIDIFINEKGGDTCKYSYQQIIEIIVEAIEL